jgi:recombination protein RecA
MKIGVVYGNPETTPGGMALKFFSSLRLSVRRKETIKDGDTQIGHVIKVTAVKNKVSSPFKETEISLFYDTGLDVLGDTIAYAVSKGIISRSGAWYSLDGEHLGQGLENVKSTLLESPKFLEKIQEKIKIGLDKPQTV